MFGNLLAFLRYVKNKNLAVGDALALAFSAGGEGELTITPRLSRSPLTLRKGGSDREVFDQVFVQLAYAADFGLQPRTIIDAGANFGASTAFFAARFPDAEIAAIEPEASNMALVKRNCADRAKVTCFQNGLYHESSPLRIKNPDCGREWAFQVEPCAESEAEFYGISVGGIMERLGWSFIDLFKIDIEGAELEVLTTNYGEWIDRVNVLVIELHDFCRPGCSEALFRALQSFPPFTTRIIGENLVISRQQFLT